MAKKSALMVPQTSLLDLSDVLHTVGCTVDVTATALASDDDPFMGRAAMLLMEHVFQPIEQAREVIKAHAKASPPPAVDYLVRDRPRRKRKARR